MDTSAGGSSRPSIDIRRSNKNECPICGQPKTAWSFKCQSCEGNRQRYLASMTKAAEDRQLLEAVQIKGQSGVARERGVSRQAVNEMVKKAQRRIEFLTANPLPPMQVPVQ